jgi:tetratricopeptide (TPR) repeat protein
VAYDARGEYDRAIADYEQALKLKPSAEGYFNRGNAHLAKRDYDHAIDDYNQAIKLKADFAAAFDNRCWARRGRRAQAGACRLQPGAPTDAEERRNIGQPRLHLSEDVSVRCRCFRL